MTFDVTVMNQTALSEVPPAVFGAQLLEAMQQMVAESGAAGSTEIEIEQTEVVELAVQTGNLDMSNLQDRITLQQTVERSVCVGLNGTCTAEIQQRRSLRRVAARLLQVEGSHTATLTITRDYEFTSSLNANRDVAELAVEGMRDFSASVESETIVSLTARPRIVTVGTTAIADARLVEAFSPTSVDTELRRHLPSSLIDADTFTVSTIFIVEPPGAPPGQPPAPSLPPGPLGGPLQSARSHALATLEAESSLATLTQIAIAISTLSLLATCLAFNYLQRTRVRYEKVKQPGDPPCGLATKVVPPDVGEDVPVDDLDLEDADDDEDDETVQDEESPVRPRRARLSFSPFMQSPRVAPHPMRAAQPSPNSSAHEPISPFAPRALSPLDSSRGQGAWVQAPTPEEKAREMMRERLERDGSGATLSRIRQLSNVPRDPPSRASTAAATHDTGEDASRNLLSEVISVEPFPTEVELLSEDAAGAYIVQPPPRRTVEPHMQLLDLNDPVLAVQQQPILPHPTAAAPPPIDPALAHLVHGLTMFDDGRFLRTVTAEAGSVGLVLARDMDPSLSLEGLTRLGVCRRPEVKFAWHRVLGKCGGVRLHPPELENVQQRLRGYAEQTDPKLLFLDTEGAASSALPGGDMLRALRAVKRAVQQWKALRASKLGGTGNEVRSF